MSQRKAEAKEEANTNGEANVATDCADSEWHQCGKGVAAHTTKPTIEARVVEWPVRLRGTGSAAAECSDGQNRRKRWRCGALSGHYLWPDRTHYITRASAEDSGGLAVVAGGRDGFGAR